MNSISEFDNGLDDDLDNCWDDKSIDSNDSIDYEARTAKEVKIAAATAIKKVPVKKIAKVVLKNGKVVAKVPTNQKTKVKAESINEFDNGFDDDLDDCWLDKSTDSDDSRDYEAQTVKKMKTSAATVIKKAPIKNNAEKSALKVTVGASKSERSKPDAKVTADSGPVKTGNTGEVSYPLEQFDLTESTVRLLKDRGIESLFPIQAETYWPIRAGKDLIGRARTGQGKQMLIANHSHDIFIMIDQSFLYHSHYFYQHRY